MVTQKEPAQAAICISKALNGSAARGTASWHFQLTWFLFSVTVHCMCTLMGLQRQDSREWGQTLAPGAARKHLSNTHLGRHRQLRRNHSVHHKDSCPSSTSAPCCSAPRHLSAASAPSDIWTFQGLWTRDIPICQEKGLWRLPAMCFIAPLHQQWLLTSKHILNRTKCQAYKSKHIWLITFSTSTLYFCMLSLLLFKAVSVNLINLSAESRRFNTNTKSFCLTTVGCFPGCLIYTLTYTNALHISCFGRNHWLGLPNHIWKHDYPE